MSRQPLDPDHKVTVPDLVAAKRAGKRISMLTAYDYPTALLLDQAGIDCLLVGDSLGMVVQGLTDGLAVTLDQMIYHGRMVARAANRALVVVDMPFLSYQVNDDEAIRNAGRILQETGAHAVKLEGGRRCVPAIRRMVEAGIPVMGHVGLTPQSVRRLGGFKVQRDADELLADAKAVEEAGAFAIVVECVPADLGKRVTQALSVPTIGIGAGPGCDGQVLVINDMLGMEQAIKPRFVKRQADLATIIRQAAERYAAEVRDSSYPGPEHVFN
ncbi:MAG: 3-methyl-2-oxobutanoate hydroxymethyltransferase [Planctomycetota bacterium]|nr:MAG: 3-methyl-2-oxobutanoate hydroxymethyltransferase [Planctomycetota bacterium]